MQCAKDSQTLQVEMMRYIIVICSRASCKQHCLQCSPYRSEVSGHGDDAGRQESANLTMQRIDFWPHDKSPKGQLSLCVARIERSHRMIISEPYIFFIFRLSTLYIIIDIVGHPEPAAAAQQQRGLVGRDAVRVSQMHVSVALLGCR